MKLAWLLLGGATALVSCEKAQKAQEAYHNFSTLKDAGEKMETSMKDAQDRHAERVKTGDTLSLPYKDLEAYLPASLDGYTGEEPSGQSMKTAGMAFSTASRSYKQGDKTLEVTVMDYNGASTLYQGASAMFALGMGFESEDDETLTRAAPLKQDGVKGIETLGKKTGDADLNLAVGDRFIVSVKASGQKDLALVEQVAQQLDLAKLAKL